MVLFKWYTGVRAWNAIGDKLEEPCSLSREDHNRKITFPNICSIVNRTIKLSNEMPTEVLATFSCKPHSFKKRVMEVFTSKGNLSG